MSKKNNQKDLKNQYRINDEIRAKEVRVVGDDIKTDIYPIEDAQKLAQDKELDLVEVSKKSNPPTCKLIDFNKFIYEQKKKKKEEEKNNKVKQKEIRFGPNTQEHDFNFKVNHGYKFLQEGSQVKAYVHFKGRNIVYKDNGEKILLEFAQALQDVGKVEKMPTMEGRRMHIILSPKKSK